MSVSQCGPKNKKRERSRTLQPIIFSVYIMARKQTTEKYDNKITKAILVHILVKGEKMITFIKRIPRAVLAV